ncbi:glycosyltransferase involved in cell wall biosynthesis [Croceifilum oryzae]|uniref:Glycosyltransferase involved in cell wall biosynthesis n=1 Tax=Croceifilum oryzae TaxID=1553429 RepID=A0AAJ1WSE4_9BACL|nr:glycosyltransferase family 4 protein [Croceifilum oryzae]MDQ0415871.1 glycosyltransferase involved in cell wall biosynthesis [Croceifilum oryzae]
MKKVMIFSSVHPCDDSRIFHKQAVSLAKTGYEVELHAISDVEEKMEQGVRIVGVKRAANRFRRLLKGYELYKRARKSGADVFHFHDPELLPWGVLLRLRTGKPVIYDVHEDLPKQIYTKVWINPKIRKPLSTWVHRIEKGLARKLTAVIAATEPIASQFAGVKHREVIKNYPLPMPMMEREEDGKNQILYVGGVSRLRGYDEMIQMMNHIPEELQAELHIIGPLQHIQVSVEEAERFSERRIYLHGRIPFTEVQQKLASGKVGLVCLHPVENYRESLPIKMFEYMSAGMPVLATDFPLWKEIVEGSDCGFTVNALDPKEMAEKVTQILTDAELAKSMSVNGRKAYEENYNWHIEEQKLLRLYQEIGS